jgi:hypothetical protein
MTNDERPETLPSDVPEPALPATVTDGLDIEAALAAVSSLSDMVAEQEAAEQARLAQIEADSQAAAERQVRIDHPERFFPVPALLVSRRGQLDSLVPALLLIAAGAWLTFTLTTSGSLPSADLLLALVVGGLGLAFVARWLTSGRWGNGVLFIGLSLMLGAGVMVFLGQSGSPGWGSGWPLLVGAVGAAMLLTAVLSRPGQGRLLLPASVLVAASATGLVVTLGLIPADLLSITAAYWPVPLVVLAVLLILPVVIRQRR